MSRKRDKKKKGKKDDKQKDVITLDVGWDIIRNSGILPFCKRVEDVISGSGIPNIPKDEYSTTYDTIFNMCIQRDPYNYSEPLYQKHSEALRHYFKTTVIPALSAAKEKHGLAFLQEWVKRWKMCTWVVDGMRRFFMYLDRFFVPNSEDLLPTAEQGYQLFREMVFNKFKEFAAASILDCIHRERENENQDRELLRDAIFVMVELGFKIPKVEIQLYQESFQKKFVAATKEYYRVKSRIWLDDNSCPEYMKLAEEAVESEADRLTAYIHNSTKDNLMECVRKELLQNHQTPLLAKKTGLGHLLEKDSTEDLARLYRLYEAIPDGLTPVALAMTEHVKGLGGSAVSRSKQDKEGQKTHKLIRDLIELHERYLTLVEKHFKKAQVFQKALKDAFEAFINADYHVSNYLARYINAVLKKGNKVAVNDLDRTLSHVVFFYGYIRDKDIFERDYQLFLANRMLNGLSQSQGAEKRMIGRLKAECGYQWAAKLENMFKDVQLSKDLRELFNKDIAKQYDTELQVSVCTTGCWPSSSIPPCNLPKLIEPVCKAFKSFYLSKYNGRRLQWRMDLGKADVKVNFGKEKSNVLVVSTFQMMILALFNDKNTISFKDISAQTQIPKVHLEAHLLSLAHPKVKILRKKPNNNKVADDHIFAINPKYSSPKYRVQVPMAVKVKKEKADDPNNVEEIRQRRRHQMDACIVRIMKARRQLKHTGLVREVIEQLKVRFRPTGQDIKKRIEALIEQDYLERDDNDRATYNYLA